jgi:hypothetical protein
MSWSLLGTGAVPANQKPLLGAVLNRAHPLAQGLKACWLLNEMGGPVVRDNVGTGMTATLTNMDPPTDWVATPYGSGLNFDGSNDYLAMASGAFPTGSWSVFLIAKFNAVAGFNTLFGVDQTGSAAVAHLYIQRHGIGGDLRAAVSITTDTSGTDLVAASGPPTAGRWYALLAVLDTEGKSLSFYVDGVFAASDSTAGTITTPKVTVSALGGAGYYNRAVVDCANSEIAAIMWWDRVLSAGDASALSASPYAMFASPSSAWALYLVTKGGARLFTELRHRMFQGPGLHGRH